MVGKIVIGILLGIGLSFVSATLGCVFLWLSWNWFLVPTFHIAEISILQAFAALLGVTAITGACKVNVKMNA